MREQRIALEHDAQPARIGLGARDVAPVQRDDALRHVRKAGNHLQGGGLAAARWAQQRDEFPFFHSQVQIGNDAQVAVVLRDVVQPQK
ncbi:hypothetical protein D3C78_1811590 [compost metagenome]